MSTLTKLTARFIRIRDKRAELAKEFKSYDDGLKESLEEVKQQMLDHLNTEGIDSVKTEEGTFFRVKKTKYWTSDWEAMHAHIKAHDLFGFFEKRLNQGAVKEYLEDNPDTVLPGLKTDTEYALTVRKS